MVLRVFILAALVAVVVARITLNLVLRDPPADGGLDGVIVFDLVAVTVLVVEFSISRIISFRLKRAMRRERPDAVVLLGRVNASVRAVLKELEVGIAGTERRAPLLRFGLAVVGEQVELWTRATSPAKRIFVGVDAIRIGSRKDGPLTLPSLDFQLKDGRGFGFVPLDPQFDVFALTRRETEALAQVLSHATRTASGSGRR